MKKEKIGTVGTDVVMDEKREEKPPEPNIVFVGKQRKYNPDKDKYELVKRDAPAFVMDSGEKIILPDGIEKGAYSEHASRLIELYPNDFKIPKGDSK